MEIKEKDAQIVCLIVKENKDKLIKISTILIGGGVEDEKYAGLLWDLVADYTSDEKEQDKIYIMLKAFLVNCLAKGLESYK